MVKSAELKVLEEQYRELADRASRLVQEVRPDELTARPKRLRWSIADCLAHLRLTSFGYLALLAPALENARREGLLSDTPYRMDLPGRFIKWSIEPPYRIHVKTQPEFSPRSADAAILLKDFLESQEELIGTIRSAEGLALEKIKIASPFSRYMRYNVFSCFHILAAHQRRHLWQADQIRRLLDSPPRP